MHYTYVRKGRPVSFAIFFIFLGIKAKPNNKNLMNVVRSSILKHVFMPIRKKSLLNLEYALNREPRSPIYWRRPRGELTKALIVKRVSTYTYG